MTLRHNVAKYTNMHATPTNWSKQDIARRIINEVLFILSTQYCMPTRQMSAVLEMKHFHPDDIHRVIQYLGIYGHIEQPFYQDSDNLVLSSGTRDLLNGFVV